MRTKASTSVMGHCRFAVSVLEISSPVVSPGFAVLVHAAFMMRMSSLPLKWVSSAERTSLTESREVMSAATPLMVGAGVSGDEL